MIISLHLPKTAGTSFAAALETHFQTRLFIDNADLPINTPQYERNRAAIEANLRYADSDLSDVECIHGHFLPINYLLMGYKREPKFVTWMRNPVERVLSHYYFWKKTYKPGKVPSHHRKVVEEDWSIERFCLGPEVRNLYWQFLWGFPIDYFDFIGITEFYENDFAYFVQHYLGCDHIEPKRLNVSGKERGAYQIDRSFRNDIEAFHGRDIDLYQRALEKRLTQRRT